MRKTHQIDPDDYRREFGIPYNRGLVSAPSRERLQASMTVERRQEVSIMLKELRRQGRMRKQAGPQRPAVPCVSNQWNQIFEKGREFSRRRVTVACVTCGAPIETTAFNATQPIHCVGCAKDKRRNRPRPWRQKKAA